MKKIKNCLWLVIIVLVFISIGLVIRRMLILLHLIRAVPVGGRFSVETNLNDHPVLTIAHILPGLIFVLLGPVLLYRNAVVTIYRVHRYAVVIFICAAYLVGFSAIFLPFIIIPVGGTNEAAATVLYGVIFIVAVTRLLISRVENNRGAYHDHLIRTLSMGLAIATTRPVMIFAFVAGKISPQLFLGTAFWIAFTIHLWIAETWIYNTTPWRKLKTDNA